VKKLCGKCKAINTMTCTVCHNCGNPFEWFESILVLPDSQTNIPISFKLVNTDEVIKDIENKQVMINNKYKELLGLLETFGYTIDYWEFTGVIQDSNRNVVARINHTEIEWEDENENI
jgi:RNA polymerase subunit RPABC4/transcription elongation factor Spt4